MTSDAHRLLRHLAHRRHARLAEAARLARSIAEHHPDADARAAARGVEDAALDGRRETKDLLCQIDRLDAATAEVVFAPNEVCAGCRTAICAPGALFCPDCP